MANMGLFFNTPEEELEICGTRIEELAGMSNEQVMLLALWRNHIATFGSNDFLSHELYFRATGRNEPG